MTPRCLPDRYQHFGVICGVEKLFLEVLSIDEWFVLPIGRSSHPTILESSSLPLWEPTSRISFTVLLFDDGRWYLNASGLKKPIWRLCGFVSWGKTLGHYVRDTIKFQILYVLCRDKSLNNMQMFGSMKVKKGRCTVTWYTMHSREGSNSSTT